MPDTFHCPRCNRLLAKTGETTAPGEPAPLDVFQCDECMSTWAFDGERFETAFTFAVDAAGRVRSAETLEPWEPDP